jgi:hypothetical protein
VLAWPLLGLAALWGWTEVRSRQGTEWLVPVAGYDPRDLLRGHYVLFQYDWPGLAPAISAAMSRPACRRADSTSRRKKGGGWRSSSGTRACRHWSAFACAMTGT